MVKSVLNQAGIRPDEELILVEYLRHSQVHLAPHMLDVKPTGKNKVTGGVLKLQTTYGDRSIYELIHPRLCRGSAYEPPKAVSPYLNSLS